MIGVFLILLFFLNNFTLGRSMISLVLSKKVFGYRFPNGRETLMGSLI